MRTLVLEKISDRVELWKFDCEANNLDVVVNYQSWIYLEQQFFNTQLEQLFCIEQNRTNRNNAFNSSFDIVIWPYPPYLFFYIYYIKIFYKSQFWAFGILHKNITILAENFMQNAELQIRPARI